MIQPLNSYLLIEVQTEDTTKGGLFIPQQGITSEATNILKKGIVKVGNESIGVSCGDIVYYNKHAITNIPDEKDLILVRKEDLYAVLK